MKAKFIITLTDDGVSAEKECVLDVALPHDPFIKLFTSTVLDSFDGLLKTTIDAYADALAESKIPKPKELTNGKTAETIPPVQPMPSCEAQRTVSENK